MQAGVPEAAISEAPARRATGPAGMGYHEFLQRFGASYRVDFLRLGPLHGGMVALGQRNRRHRVKQALRRRLATVGLSDMDPVGYVRSGNKRPFRLPWRAGLPREFIRLDPWEAEYLFVLASHSRLGILETGRFHGGSTFLLACANHDVPITSIDIDPQDDDLLRSLLARHGVGANLELIVGDSQHVKNPQVGELDLLFVDGDHSYEGCKADLDNWYEHVVPGGHMVLHDCYEGIPVKEAAIDFTAERDPEVVRSPHIPVHHWHEPTGSLAHFVKRG